MKVRVLLLLAAFACITLVARAAPVSTPLILISLDGFRWDYCDLHPAETPHLRQLKRDGVSAHGLIPVFPSNTFPNHYTIVTGLYPAHHGIVNNDFFDPTNGNFFHYNQPISVHDPRWWGGEPIWVTATKQGQKSAASFWVGSEAEIRGARPTFWKPYDYKIPFETRLDELAGWLTLPPDQRPAFIAFYLEETNSAGHQFGPASPEVTAAIKLLDTRIGAILERLHAAGIDPNLVVVSDHGMAQVTKEHVLILEDYFDRATLQIDAEGTVVGLRPRNDDPANAGPAIDALMRAATRVPHAKVYRAADLPERFHLRDNPRIPPVVITADEGWNIVARATYERLHARYPIYGYLQGDHGYDPAFPSMHGIFIAHGPAFRRGVELPEVENVHIYNLLCAVLGLGPAPNDGDDRLVKAALRR